MQAFLSEFVPLWGENPMDLSLYSFQPNCHVKIYKLYGAFELMADLRDDDFPVVFHNTSGVHNTAVLVWINKQQPKWVAHGSLHNHAHELLVVHYHPESMLLFVCSTLRQNEIYDYIVKKYVTGTADILPLCKLKRVMAGWEEATFFNVGMRSRRAAVGAESYKVVMGSAAHDAVLHSDGLNYVRGHTYGKGIDEDGESLLLGMSGSSKIWSSEYLQIPELVAWCDKLAAKINNPACDHMVTPLGHLDCGKQVDTVPTTNPIFAGDWNLDSYAKDRQAVLTCADGTEVFASLPELAITVDTALSDATRIVFAIGNERAQVDFEFTMDPVAYRALPGQVTKLELVQGFKRTTLDRYLLENPPVFYYTDLSSIERDVYSTARTNQFPFDVTKVETVDWSAAGVCIHSEEYLVNPKTCACGTRTIHEHFKATLPSDFDVVIYDQGAGEIADVVGLKGGAEPRVVLYHCKGTKEAKAGCRVDDMYEVCGQAIKSVVWANRSRLMKKVNKQREKREYVKGTKQEAIDILEGFPSQALPLEVVVVQPGLDSAELPKEKARKMSDLLAAVELHLQTQGDAAIRVICT